MSDAVILKMYENDIKLHKEEIKDLEKEIERRNTLIQKKRQFAREIKGRDN